MTEATENRSQLNRNLAQMLKGGVIMDVTTPEQAHIAEEAGACALWPWSAFLQTFAQLAACRA